MEAIKDYKDLLFSLIENCVPIIPLLYNQTEPMAIDNVYQADIIPENLNPVEVSKLKIKLNNIILKKIRIAKHIILKLYF